jgi:SAM-dependent methyltransferase
MTRAETAYHGELGEHFAAHATQGAANAYIDRPAMLELAGDVSGLRVLDVGCGAGHYAAELLDRGAAELVGTDGSETLLRIARERLGDTVALHCHSSPRRIRPGSGSGSAARTSPRSTSRHGPGKGSPPVTGG